MNEKYIKKIEDYANQLEKSPVSWDCGELCDWIEEILQLPEYLVALRKKNISGKKMALIIDSVESLKKLGFTKIGPRRILMQQFNILLSKFSIVLKKPHQKKYSSLEDIKSQSYGLSSLKKKKSYESLFHQNSLNNFKLFSEEEMDPSIIEVMEGCGDIVFQWKSKEVSTWLKGLGLSSLIEVFEKNKIHGDILLDVTENTLKELGITSMGVTKKILNSIERIHPQYFKKKEEQSESNISMKTSTKAIMSKIILKGSNITLNKSIPIKSPQRSPKKKDFFDTERLAKKWDVNLVCNWIESIGFSEYSSNFRKNEIDGSILFKLSKDDLSEIGIESIGHQKKILSEISNLKNC